jgi:mannose-6-phosphate isomerase-like protein (cupin superfamily)
VAAHATPQLTSPDGLARLRILGPIELAGRFEWYELIVQSGGVLASQAHEDGSREHLSVLSGRLEVEAGAQRQTPAVGRNRTLCRPTSRHAIRNTQARSWRSGVAGGAASMTDRARQPALFL